MDRIIAVPSGDGEMWASAVRAGLNVVFADRRVWSPGQHARTLDEVPAVLSDDRSGLRTAIEYLTGLGHRKIGFLARQGMNQRVAAFREAMGDLLDEDLVVFARASRDSAYAAAAGLFQRPGRPDGGDRRGTCSARRPCWRPASSMYASRATCRSSCSTTSPGRSCARPPLTVIAQPASDVGYRAAELVLRHGRRPGRSRCRPS